MDPHKPDVFYATTIVSVRRNGRVVVAGDGQVTLGHTVMKSNARSENAVSSTTGAIDAPNVVHPTTPPDEALRGR